MHSHPALDHRAIVAVAALICLGSVCGGCSNGDIERRIAVEPGGEVSVDIVLGSGFSFDHGSLELTSDDIDEVSVTTETSGWGGYAVDVDVDRSGEQVRIVGRVDGALHWMFGGPTVDFRVVVPSGLRVDASIDGGDMLVEDLVGAVSARVKEAEITLRRSDGAVALVSDGGAIRVEDLEGPLRVESGGGEITVNGVMGRVDLASGGGRTSIASVTGRVSAISGRGEVELHRIRGDVTVRSGRGRVAIDDVEGGVSAETDRGRIEVTGLDGPIEARSNRGGIDIQFVSPAAGSIDSTRGSIRIEAPGLYGFDLDAQTERGEIELDRHFAFAEMKNEPEVASVPSESLEELERLGQQVAAEVQTRAAAEWEDVRRGWEQWRETGDLNWDPHPSVERWSQPWPWHEWDADQRDLGRPYREWAREVADRSASRFGGQWEEKWKKKWKDGHQLRGHINGGGALLRVRSERGSIRIDQ